MNDLIFHEDKARDFIKYLHDTYMSREYLYKHVHHLDGHAPQRMFLPKGVEEGGLEHSIFLFYTTLMDYLSVSYDIFATSNYLWRNYHELFTEEVLTLTENDIAIILKMSKSTMPTSKAYRWLGSSRTLYHSLGGDPRNIFSSGNSIDEIDAYRGKRSRNDERSYLPGYGPKLLSLLALHYYDFGIIEELPQGTFPVDRHIQRQLIGMGIVECALSEYDAAKGIAEFIRPRLVQ